MNQPKSKFLVIIIISLLVANLVMLSILIFNGRQEIKKPQREKNHVKEFLQGEVGFSQEQLNNYEKLTRKHRENLKALSRNQSAARNEILMQLPNESFTDSAILRTGGALNTQQLMFHVNMLNHLRDIRNLCTDSQRAVFDTGFYKIIGRRYESRKEK